MLIIWHIYIQFRLSTKKETIVLENYKFLSFVLVALNKCEQEDITIKDENSSFVESPDENNKWKNRRLFNIEKKKITKIK